jgi:hypothetical protein
MTNDESSTPVDLDQLWPEPWASHAAMQAVAIKGELDRALAGTKVSAAENAVKTSVETMLQSVQLATQHGKSRRRSLIDRWRGTSVVRAHYYLHAAKIALVDVLDTREVNARIPGAVARVDTCLPPTDVRRPSIDKLLAVGDLPLEEKRAGLKRALEIGYGASDQLHGRIRGFRNLLIMVAITILLFMGCMIVVVSVSPDSVPLCFNPSITSAQAAATSQDGPDAKDVRTVCPSGQDPPTGPYDHKPERRDIWIVAGLGLLGGAIAAAFAIRNLRGTSIPYDVPLALAFLKVPIGALTAVAGILLLGGGFVPGLSELDSQRQILAYALLLGYAQQVATKLIDRQAQTLMDAVPSKDPDGRQPSQPAPTDDRQQGQPPPPDGSPAPTITTTTHSNGSSSNGASSNGTSKNHRGRAPARQAP